MINSKQVQWLLTGLTAFGLLQIQPVLGQAPKPACELKHRIQTQTGDVVSVIAAKVSDGLPARGAKIYLLPARTKLASSAVSTPGIDIPTAEDLKTNAHMSLSVSSGVERSGKPWKNEVFTLKFSNLYLSEREIQNIDVRLYDANSSELLYERLDLGHNWKDEYVRREGLDNFYLDIDVRKSYSELKEWGETSENDWIRVQISETGGDVLAMSLFSFDNLAASQQRADDILAALFKASQEGKCQL